MSTTTSNKVWFEKWYTDADEAQAAGCKTGMNKFKAYPKKVSGKGKKCKPVSASVKIKL